LRCPRRFTCGKYDVATSESANKWILPLEAGTTGKVVRHTYVWIYVHMYGCTFFICSDLCMYLCMCVCVYGCTYFICSDLCMYLHMYVCMGVLFHMGIAIYVCTYVWVYFLHMYIWKAYIYTYTPPLTLLFEVIQICHFLNRFRTCKRG
jgi:hypothetical protein